MLMLIENIWKTIVWRNFLEGLKLKYNIFIGLKNRINPLSYLISKKILNNQLNWTKDNNMIYYFTYSLTS